MAARLELRANYEQHRQRIDTSKSGRFSLELPKSFPLRNNEALFVGTCYEKTLSSFDRDDPSRAPPPRVVRERPGWDQSVVVTHGLAGYRPRSAGSVAASRRRQEGARAKRPHRPDSAGGSTFGVSSLSHHAGWGAHESMLTESPIVDAHPHATPAAISTSSFGATQATKSRDPNWSVDLSPEQSKAFVEFVTLLNDVDSSGGMSMVHLAQAAVDQATALRQGSERSAGGLQPP